jgi:hypothetical protein
MTLAPKKEKIFAVIILVALTIALIPVLTPKTRVNAADTNLVVLPATINFLANQSLPGTEFLVNVTVVNVTALANWQVNMTWDPTLLEFVNTTFPSDYVWAELPPGHSKIEPAPILTPSSVTLGSTFFPYNWGFNGTGTLCQVALRILAPPAWSTGNTVTASLELVNPIDNTFIIDTLEHDIAFGTSAATYTYTDPLTVTLSPPASITVPAGSTVDFTATPSNGVPAYTYQWFFTYPNGTQILVPGATENTWTTYPIDEAGNYQVTASVTDSLGASANATTLVRIAGLSLTISPESPVVDAGGNVTFTANVTGGLLPYLIQWYLDGVENVGFQNMTSATFVFSLPGTYEIKANATDTALNSAFKTATVAVLASTSTVVSIVPATGEILSNVTVVGDVITVNVTVESVSELQNWEVKIAWDPTLLTFSKISLPAGHVFWPIDSSNPDAIPGNRSMVPVPPSVGSGTVVWGATYDNINFPFWVFNGTGTLCTLELKVLQQPAPQSTFDVAVVDRYVPLGTFLLFDNQTDMGFSLGAPAMYTYTLVPQVTHAVDSFTVITFSNTTIRANNVTRDAADNSITFFASGAVGTGYYINVTVPKEMIRGPWHNIIVAGLNFTTTATIREDTTNTYIYFEYHFHSFDTIYIQGSVSAPAPGQYVNHTVTINGVPYLVVTFSNGTIAANSVTANVPTRTITFNVTGTTGDMVYVNVTVNNTMMHDAWNVTVNGASFMLNNAAQGGHVVSSGSNSTNSWVYLELTLGTPDTVAIQATFMIPEQTAILLIALAAASAITLLLSRKTLLRRWIK